ncbi:solute carrier family 22 member 6-like isoform X3 [Columba livia]|uniref:solute carrier family 22 member 6-like isoform X3 n=1 Tax=Columba livia TaxID=8932 RepID=UPI0031BA8B8C
MGVGPRKGAGPGPRGTREQPEPGLGDTGRNRSRNQLSSPPPADLDLAMTFAELLARLGGMGRFQVWYVASLAVPLLMLASHNVLQNFTAGVPEHHCRPRAAANGSAADVPLVVAIPHDGHQRPQRCRRFVEHQWGLLGANGTNGTGGSAATEPCRDGWTYRDGIFTRTVVTEWDLVCEAKALRDVAQSIYMAGVLLGSILFGVLSDRYGVDPHGRPRRGRHHQRLLLHAGPVRAGRHGLCVPPLAPAAARRVPALLPLLPLLLVISGRPDLALKGLRKVARVNGRRDEGDKLSPEVLQALGVPGGSGGGVATLIRSPGIRRVSGGVACVWFSTSFAYYGLAMDLQGFGVDVYVSQLLFAAVDVPAKLASAVAVMRGGRRVAQAGSLALAGGCILATMLVPNELQALRLTLAVIGKGALAASFNCAYIFTGELFPTAIRQTGLGLGSTMARVGGMMAPLVRVAGDVAPVLPPIIYGVTPVLSALLTLLLPETRNVPLPETLRDLEMRAGHPKAADAATVTVPLSDTRA